MFLFSAADDRQTFTSQLSAGKEKEDNSSQPSWFVFFCSSECTVLRSKTRHFFGRSASVGRAAKMSRIMWLETVNKALTTLLTLCRCCVNWLLMWVSQTTPNAESPWACFTVAGETRWWSSAPYGIGVGHPANGVKRSPAKCQTAIYGTSPSIGDSSGRGLLSVWLHENITEMDLGNSTWFLSNWIKQTAHQPNWKETRRFPLCVCRFHITREMSLLRPRDSGAQSFLGVTQWDQFDFRAQCRWCDEKNKAVRPRMRPRCFNQQCHFAEQCIRSGIGTTKWWPNQVTTPLSPSCSFLHRKGTFVMSTVHSFLRTMCQKSGADHAALCLKKKNCRKALFFADAVSFLGRTVVVTLMLGFPSESLVQGAGCRVQGGLMESCACHHCRCHRCCDMKHRPPPPLSIQEKIVQTYSRVAWDSAYTAATWGILWLYAFESPRSTNHHFVPRSKIATREHLFHDSPILPQTP